MTILFAPAHAHNTYWQSPSLTTASKRKRSSCASQVRFTSSGSLSDPTMETDDISDVGDDSRRESCLMVEARAKRNRTFASQPEVDVRTLPTSSANIPFSSDFRSTAAYRRPPTVEEQQSWASSSSRPSSSPSAGVYASPASRMADGAVSVPTNPAANAWTKVTTDYGHAWERVEDYKQDGATSPRQDASSSSLWQHIEGDADMSLFDPDTFRRGDAFSWNDDVLQCKGPTQGECPTSAGFSQPHEARAQMGASYFDQSMWQAMRS